MSALFTNAIILSDTESARFNIFLMLSFGVSSWYVIAAFFSVTGSGVVLGAGTEVSFIGGFSSGFSLLGLLQLTNKGIITKEKITDLKNILIFSMLYQMSIRVHETAAKLCEIKANE